MHGKLLLATVLTMAMASAAYGDIMLDGSGMVTGWGLTPFTQPNQANVQQGGMWSTIQNNYSPISYPGVGHQPSPGVNSGGEAYDLEELHVRINNQQLQLLLVTSSPLVSAWGGHNFYLGDLMLSIDDQKFGIVTQSASQGLAQGAIYGLNAGDTVGLQPLSGSYWNSTAVLANDYGPNATVPNIIGGWAVSDDISASQLLGLAQVNSATFNYGGSENGTYLLEYTFDLGLLGLTEPGNITAQVAWGCGNDVIRTTGGPIPAVPEPGTLLMLAAGSAFMYVSARRKERKERRQQKA